MASLHTSLYPPEHGAVGATTPLPDELTTLAEALQGVGYDTMAFVAQTFVGRRYGLAQGFRAFDESLAQGPGAVTSEKLTALALRYLRRLEREPFFLWVHYFDPHYGYVRHPQFGFVDAPPELALDRLTYEELVAAQPLLADDATPDPFTVEMVKAIYDEEIAFTDAAIGSLLEGINNLDIDRSAVTVLTADDGEYFIGTRPLRPRQGRVRRARSRSPHHFGRYRRNTQGPSLLGERRGGQRSPHSGRAGPARRQSFPRRRIYSL